MAQDDLKELVGQIEQQLSALRSQLDAVKAELAYRQAHGQLMSLIGK